MAGVGRSLLLWFACPLAFAQTGIGPAWDQLLASDTIAAIPAAQSPPAPAKHTAEDFLNHFYFEDRTSYERSQTNFTGNPTTAGFINAPDTGVFNPAGIPSPTAFLPGADRVSTFLDFGTRGFGSDRITTHFSFRYRQDLDSVPVGSPAANITETFPGNRLYEFLDGTISIAAKPGDGIFAGTSAQFGRLNLYGAELASLDGAALTLNRPRFELTLYGGRRFSFFSDPAQRAIGGANLILKTDPSFSIELQTLWYVKGTNKIVIRKRFRDRWLISSYLRSYGGAPVDFSASGLFSSSDGRTSFRAGFFQKLTDDDYTYDYTSDARDLAAKNPLYRLYLGPVAQYSQFNIEIHRQLSRRIRAGADVVVRRLDENNMQGPFDTSFEDYRVSAQIFPLRKIETLFEFHQRNSDRLSPLYSSTLDNISTTGETSVKDLSGEVRRSFREGRLNLSGGVYYRRIDFQDHFYYMNDLHQSGILGSASLRLDRRTRLFFDYSLDNDFFLFAPDIRNSEIFRLGVTWKY